MTNFQTLSRDALLAHVETAGRLLPPDLIRALLARRIELRDDVLARFAAGIDDDWADPDDPRWYRAVHFGYLLIAYRERKALPIFAAIYHHPERYESLIEWFEDTPAHFGPAALPVFQAIIEAAPGLEWDYGVGMSVSILTEIAGRFPETRADVVQFLRAFLPPLHMNGHLHLDNDEEINELWGDIAGALAALHDRESMTQVLFMFDAELIDPMQLDRESYLELLNEPQPKNRGQTFDILAHYALLARRNESNQA